MTLLAMTLDRLSIRLNSPLLVYSQPLLPPNNVLILATLGLVGRP